MAEIAFSVVVRLLLLVSSSVLQLASCQVCPDADSDYTFTDTEGVWLMAVCRESQVDLSWSVGDLIAQGSNFLFNYECSSDTQFFRGRLPSVSVGPNAILEMTVPAPHFTASENNTQLLVCQFFGCYYDIEDYYLFNRVNCTFGREATSSQPSPEATLNPPPSMTIGSSSRLVTTLGYNPALSSSYHPRQPTTQYKEVIVVPTTIQANTASSTKLHIMEPETVTASNSGTPTGALQSSYSLEGQVQVSATFSSLEGQVQASATRQLSSTGGQLFVGPDSGQLPAWIAAVSIIIGVVLLSLGVLLLVVLRKYYLRMRQQRSYPLKVIPGLNDDTRIDHEFFPVLVQDIPRPPSVYSIVTVIDRFGDSRPLTPVSPASVTLIPFHMQDHYDRVMEFVQESCDIRDSQERDDLSPHYGSKLYKIINQDGSHYVTIYPDESGFGSEDHSYFSVTKPRQPNQEMTEFHQDHSSEKSTLAEDDTCRQLPLDHNKLSSIPEVCQGKSQEVERRPLQSSVSLSDVDEVKQTNCSGVSEDELDESLGHKTNSVSLQGGQSECPTAQQEAIPGGLRDLPHGSGEPSGELDQEASCTSTSTKLTHQ